MKNEPELLISQLL